MPEHSLATGGNDSLALKEGGLIEGSESDGASLNRLVERQALWPEFGPPNCFWGLCQFEGPACIFFCTEEQVLYGSDKRCRGRRVVERGAVPVSDVGRVDSSALMVLGGVLLGLIGLVEVEAWGLQ
jgi:hypothetical protein